MCCKSTIFVWFFSHLTLTMTLMFNKDKNVSCVCYFLQPTYEISFLTDMTINEKLIIWDFENLRHLVCLHGNNGTSFQNSLIIPWFFANFQIPWLFPAGSFFSPFSLFSLFSRACGHPVNPIHGVENNYM